ncbi:hypothetical protein [Trinickia mobilis]|uniref:hypothetical protein n=1 Tax=Trinickia mobilis TaxID=2816356 RepID=UPI001A8BF4E5|nr:hypothetical protein [Trinickia mobilis]
MQALSMKQAAVFSSPRVSGLRVMADTRSVMTAVKVKFTAEDLAGAELEQSEVSVAMRRGEFSLGDAVQWFDDVRINAALALDDM